jgi:hypothetical protein
VVRVAPADKSDGIAAWGVDGEHEPVAVSVDEPAGAGAGGQPGGEQFGVGGVGVLAEVAGEVGPSGRGVAGQKGAADQVGVQSLDDIVGGPAGGVVGTVIGQGGVVEFEQPAGGDATVRGRIGVEGVVGRVVADPGDR